MNISRTRLLGATLPLLTLLAYLPALRCGFIWDDDLYITANRALVGWRGLYDIWFGLFRFATCQYYPLTFTGFWIQNQLWGLNPIGFHLVNILLQGFNAWLLWLVLRRLRIPGAWLAAAIFALHPVHVMSVAWATELKNVLAGGFMLGSLLVYLGKSYSSSSSSSNISRTDRGRGRGRRTRTIWRRAGH